MVTSKFALTDKKVESIGKPNSIGNPMAYGGVSKK